MSVATPPDFADNPVFQKIWHTIYRKRGNFIILVTGLPRTGKSTLCQSLAYCLERHYETFEHTWDCKSSTFSTFKDLLDAMTNNKRKLGKVWVWEEAGAVGKGANARTFYDKLNIVAGTIFQTMGFKRNILIVNLPSLGMLDKQLRSLIHCWIKTMHINPDRGTITAQLKWSKMAMFQNRDERLMYQFPRYYVDGIKCVAKTIEVGLPPEKVLKDYKELEKNFKNTWMDEYNEILQNGNKVGRPIAKIPEIKVYENPEDLINYWNFKKNCLDVDLVANNFKISTNKARALCKTIMKKIELKELAPPTNVVG